MLNFFDWCKRCKSNHFKLNYGEFPSGNNDIDKILKDNYCDSKSLGELIEWIPYNEFKITDIFNEESLKLYNAIWSNGYICDWSKDKLNWNRSPLKVVTLMNFDGLNNILNHINK